MAMNLKQTMKLGHHLMMTPQLKLAIQILQFSSLELTEHLRTELEENPVLEDDTKAETPEVEKKSDEKELEWEQYMESYEGSSAPSIDFNAREENEIIEKRNTANETLKDALLIQLHVSDLTEEQIEIGEFILGNIDHNGYVRVLEREITNDDLCEEEILKELASLYEKNKEEVLEVLTVMQNFEPAGVMARTTRECLLLQAMRLPVRDTVAEEIIKKHLHTLARKNISQIAKAMRINMEEVIEAVKIITETLNPVPGTSYGTDDSHALLPDVFIEKVENDYVVIMNEDGMPRLKLSSYYRQMLKSKDASLDKEAKGYVQEKVKSALYLIKSVNQRQRTIYKVTQSIVKFQREFLDKGLKFLTPMVLKDVAEDIGVHESTVSRVTTNKFVHTPRGVFELKYFFSGSVGASNGDDINVKYIKDTLNSIIEKEDKDKPLRDQELVELLNKKGISLARRTVAKYRTELGFGTAGKRKAFY